MGYEWYANDLQRSEVRDQKSVVRKWDTDLRGCALIAKFGIRERPLLTDFCQKRISISFALSNSNCTDRSLRILFKVPTLSGECLGMVM